MARMTCDFCPDAAHYQTDEGTSFCHWHTLLYFLGYTYVLTT